MSSHRDELGLTTGLAPAFPASRAAWGTAGSLRAWQAEALRRYLDADPEDHLVVATPGAGKTAFALALASELLRRRTVDRLVVVAPTDHLKTQWAQAGDQAGIALDPEAGTGKRSNRQFTGIVLTYAGVAASPHRLRALLERHRTLVILDEVHHAGDSRSWGEAVKEAFEPARRRLALTGTPFRSDSNPIPFIRYEPFEAGLRSAADYTYGYAQALAERIVRPVVFVAYSGDLQWRTSAGDEMAARLGQPLTRQLEAQALRTALDSEGSWIPAVLAAADRRLSEVRRRVPDAGGLVIATDQAAARAYAETLRRITGKKPALVLSDEPGSSKQISTFAANNERWMVAVRMVSEGVDVPRLCVGVYATQTATPLFFAQAVGRFVRARARGEVASVFLPSTRQLLSYAASLEAERDHVLRADQAGADDEEQLLLDDASLDGAAVADELTEESGPGFAALASEADFDKVVFDGADFELVAEHDEDLGLPGLLDPDQVRALLQRRKDQKSAASPKDRGDADQAKTESTYRQLRALRKELNGLVAAWNHRTDTPHSVIHADLRKACGGPALASASTEEIQLRIDTVRRWATERRK